MWLVSAGVGGGLLDVLEGKDCSDPIPKNIYPGPFPGLAGERMGFTYRSTGEPSHEAVCHYMGVALLGAIFGNE